MRHSYIARFLSATQQLLITIHSEVGFWFSKNYKIIYDVGANVGYTDILAYLANPESKIVLIDPNPEALCVAAKNAILNKFSQNCVFLNAFVSDKDDLSIDFYTVW